MRPRVHRHLAGQLMTLAREHLELTKRPENKDYENARELMSDAVSLAMKHSMRASVFHGRGHRDEEADSWRRFREAIRRARTYHGWARILEMDQSEPQEI